MKMVAQVRVTVNLPFDADVLEIEQAPEEDVLASRTSAAIKAEQLAEAAFPEAVSILIEEVREA